MTGPTKPVPVVVACEVSKRLASVTGAAVSYAVVLLDRGDCELLQWVPADQREAFRADMVLAMQHWCRVLDALQAIEAAESAQGAIDKARGR